MKEINLDDEEERDTFQEEPRFPASDPGVLRKRNDATKRTDANVPVSEPVCLFCISWHNWVR